MNVIEGINSRYSVRAFKPDPVPRKMLEELLTIAQRSPSWANTQTWEFAVVGGDVMEYLRKMLVDKDAAQADRVSDIPYPEWKGQYRERRSRNGHRLYEYLGIRRDDVEAQLNWFGRMYQFFGAPNAIYIYTDKDISTWAIFNCGLIAQTISLAALHYGLGSIMLATSISYPSVVKQKLNIPESKQVVIGIAIGYPDNDALENKYRTERVPLSEICSWHGF